MTAFEALCLAQKQYLKVHSDAASEGEIVREMISREKAHAALWKELEKL